LLVKILLLAAIISFVSNVLVLSANITFERKEERKGDGRGKGEG